MPNGFAITSEAYWYLLDSGNIRQKIKDPEIDSPPMNITEEDPIKGLKYAAIEVPSGVRGG